MTGIYDDKFVQYLRDNLGDPIKITSKNIVCRCPWCEYGKTKSHYHLYISLEAPIFHCFFGACNEGGILAKFLKKIEGKDISSKFVDEDKIKENVKRQISLTHERVGKSRKLVVPPVDENLFMHKALYVKKRLKFSNVDLKSIKGLIFDVGRFIEENNIGLDPKMFRLKEYLHSNFVGFLSENDSVVMFRNIDDKASFSFYKLKIRDTEFLDYYKIGGSGFNKNAVVLAEGIFDIFSEHTFDVLGLRNVSRLYASALSTSYQALIKSIVFNEQVFRVDVHILSDKGVKLEYYKKLKKFNSHIINSLSVYYNKTGKDFNDTPVLPVQYKV